MRKLTALLAAVGLGFALVLSAAQQPGQQDRVAGNWKTSFLLVERGELLNLWLFKIDVKDGKLTGSVDTVPDPDIPKTTMQSVALKDDNLTIVIEFDNEPINLAFKVPKDKTKRLTGTMSIQGRMFPVQLELTKDVSAKEFKPETKIPLPKEDFKELKDDIAKRAENIGIFTLAHRILGVAVSNKVPVADLKAALVPAFVASRGYGDWHREVLFRFASDLVGLKGYASLGEELAQEGLKRYGTGIDDATELRWLGLLALSLQQQNKMNDLAKLRTRIDTLELKGHEENEKAGLGFAPDKVAGRKGKRVVLVELFTGAQCPPCVAADLAFEGLAKTYPTSDVVLLQYHLHIPRPDPMTTADSEARQKYYDFRGTPSIFFNGKHAELPGGYRVHAPATYKEYRELIDPQLNDNNIISLAVEAQRTNDVIAISAAAAGYKASDKLKLRLALIEPWVRYPGSNGLSFHSYVVRAMPGGPAGFTLNKDSVKQTAKVDLAELRETASKFLEQMEGHEFLNGQRPFSYRNLRVVAFVQNDETKEVLHAVEVPVK